MDVRTQDREQCAQDLIDAARASFSTQQPHLAIARFTSWCETATAIAAGLGTQPVEWLDEDDDARDDRPTPPTGPEKTAAPRPVKRKEYVLKHATKQSKKD